MKNFIIQYKSHIISYFIAIGLGVLGHFLYDLLSQPLILIPFVTIDESVFEHLKLLFYPILVVSTIEGVIQKYNLPSFISSRVISVIISSIMLVIFHYIVTFINNGNPVAILDISSYFIFMLTTYIIADNLYNEYEDNRNFVKIGLTMMFVYIAFLTFFSWYKPDFTFFKE